MDIETEIVTFHDYSLNVDTTNSFLDGYDKICRTCLSKTSTVLKSVFSSKTESELLFSDMLMAVTTLNIRNEDNLPAFICLKCIDKLMNAYSFKTTCEQSEKVLLNYITKESEPKKVAVDIQQFKCNICDKCLSSKSALNKHLRTIHTVKSDEDFIVTEEIGLEKTYQCAHCPYLLTNMEMLKRHVITSHNAKKQKCKEETDFVKRSNLDAEPTNCIYCGYVFDNGDQLRKHLRAKHLDISQSHENGSTIKCKLCGINSKNIKLHMAEHYKFTYCYKCQVKFASVGAFETHMKKNKHKPPRLIKCDECGKGFMRLANLKNHIAIHKEQNPYSCDICHRKFGTAGYLKQHQHNVPACTICAIHFETLNDLQLHTLTIHQSYGRISCTNCKKRFNATAQLNKHLINKECNIFKLESNI